MDDPVVKPDGQIIGGGFSMSQGQGVVVTSMTSSPVASQCFNYYAPRSGMAMYAIQLDSPTILCNGD